jgi:glycosyltransferase involved in cell wall biosynthesis
LPTDLPLPRDVLLFSTADWDHPFWTNKQHVASHLARRGFRVLYVESLGLRRPTVKSRDVARVARRLRHAVQGVRQVEDNLWVASPLVIPWHDNRLARWFNDRFLQWWLKRQCDRLGFRDPILWTYNPLVGPMAARLGGSLLVYHCVDDLSAAPHLPAAAIERAEQELAHNADLVFTTSQKLHAQLLGFNPTATHFLPNVADYGHFSKARSPGAIPDDLAAIPRPRLGFVGALSTYKVDFDLIAAVAKARPDWHWVLIGQVGEGQPDTSIAALRLPNIHLLGPRAYAQLPSYLRGLDVATIPARANPYTAAMFPMKFFEYLAAGLPVVASHVPAVADFSGACDLVASDTAFVAAVDRVLAGQRPELEYCLQLARRFTWQWRMQEMLTLLERAWQTRHGRTESRDVGQQRLRAG